MSRRCQYRRRSPIGSSGHQQMTDASLLGLAVKENGVLVTTDRGIGYPAGPRYRHNLLLLEPYWNREL